MLHTPAHTLLCMVALAVIAGVFSMLLTRWLIRLLPQWGMVDKPDFKRHIHKVPVPRGGGNVIACTAKGEARNPFYLQAAVPSIALETDGGSFRFPPDMTLGGLRLVCVRDKRTSRVFCRTEGKRL